MIEADTKDRTPGPGRNKRNRRNRAGAQAAAPAAPRPAPAVPAALAAPGDAALPATLTPEERSRLQELESIVERHLAEFVAVGQALLEIRQRHLYRETATNWLEYCRTRWGISGTSGDNRIRAFQVHQALVKSGRFSREELPQTMRQALALPAPGATSQDRIATVWEQARTQSGPAAVTPAAIERAGRTAAGEAYAGRERNRARNRIGLRLRAERLLDAELGRERRDQVVAILAVVPAARRAAVLRALGRLLA